MVNSLSVKKYKVILKYLLILLLIVSGLLIMYFKFKNTQTVNESPQNIIQEEKNDYIINTEKYVNGEISIEYPQVQGLEGDLDLILNKRFKDDALSYYLPKDTEDDQTLDPKKDYMKVKYEIKTKSPEMLSIFMLADIYESGHPYPLSFPITYNINPKTGKDIKLSDICNVDEYSKNIYEGKKYKIIFNGDLEGFENNEEKEIYKKNITEYVIREMSEKGSSKKIAKLINKRNLFYQENGKNVIFFDVIHAVGDYVKLMME